MSSVSLRLAASASRMARTAPARAARLRSRHIHQRKQLPYPIEEGLGSFLPPNALKVVAQDYQQGLLDRLNDEVRGTRLENRNVVQTIINAARDPNMVLEFNYACEALNNSFFLENLKPPPENAANHEHVLGTTHLEQRIRFHYGSLAHFQSSFSAAVLGMFSSGWIWLVTNKHGHLAIVPTFGPGTLLVRSGEPISRVFSEWQTILGEPTLRVPPQSTAPTTPAAPQHPPPSSSPVSGTTASAPPLNPHTPARNSSISMRPSPAYQTADKGAAEPTREGELFPLLCVSVHEHAWVSAGYGVWGKEEYMKRFWSVVDWEKVAHSFRSVVGESGRKGL